MALTESRMLPLGTTAPPFSLPEPLTGRLVSLEDIATTRVFVVMFLCNHCPYVIHVLPELKRLTEEYAAKGVAFAAISANDVEKYPADAPDLMAALARREGWTFPYLYDESQEVARAYDAACTPDFYVFSADRRLYYRGRLDGSRPGNDLPLTGADLRAALDEVLTERPAPDKQYPSAGCNIKWKI